jgi:N6-L-threonylcarbamoyladenine synthase
MPESLVLGIETSCDETAVAVVRDFRQVLANEVASQMDLHSRYGGVVPEVASRQHLETLPALIREALRKSNASFEDLTGVAVTASPGLIGALLVGLSTAKGLAFRLGLPLATVHHVEAHLYAVELDSDPVNFPAVGLAISGGHTELYLMEHWGAYRLLCSTRDDAAGEAFDKVAKLMGLGYPGGPLIEKLAEGSNEKGLFSLARMKDKTRDFSFSGLKTAVMLELRKNPIEGGEEKIRLAARFQNTVLEEVRSRTAWALETHRPASLVVGGGVACNEALREVLQKEAGAFGAVFRVPPARYCSDNAAMIAGLGACRLSQGKTATLSVTASSSGSFI